MFVSGKTAAQMLGIHQATLIRWADRGLIPCYRIPGARGYGHRRYDVEAFLARFSIKNNNKSSALDDMERILNDEVQDTGTDT